MAHNVRYSASGNESSECGDVKRNDFQDDPTLRISYIVSPPSSSSFSPSENMDFPFKTSHHRSMVSAGKLCTMYITQKHIYNTLILIPILSQIYSSFTE